MAYKIFTDSSADLSPSILNKYNISVIPLTVHFGEEEYSDLTPKAFYEKLENSKELPSTSQVPPSRFCDAFEKELEKGNKVICVTIGSRASGTHQSAIIAKESLDSDDIYLVDSNSLSNGTGYIVLWIAKGLQEGKPIEEVLKEAKALTENKIEVIFSVDTLKYLKKGGRIAPSKAFIAQALNIKPILKVEDAITVPIDKIRGRRKLIKYYINHMKNNFDVENNPYIFVGHSVDEISAQKLADAIKEEFAYKGEIIISEVGSIVGTHAGPGMLSMYYMKK